MNKQEARIELAYCNGFDAGQQAAMSCNDIKMSKLLESIELRRLKALQVLRPENNLRNYKEIYINLKMNLSNCCDYQVKENTDICGKCGEHCETILK